MGAIFGKFWNKFFNYAEFKVVIVGLDNAGKTTTLYKLLLNEVVATTPTIGSNVEEFTYKNIRFLMWDLGGQEVLRSSWNTYYINSQAVILVIDSTDRDRLSTVKEELFRILPNENLMNAIILIFANKQDIKGAMSAAEISNVLNLHTIKDHDWHIQSCCALTGDGLEQGMEWLSQQVK
eukprot:TRINITY_DN1139_c0_g1_i1.p1 TRINITY_DN1139_c0_g1~~TRINITY_DN1139_c0_g1_i1.p1  ORF type:complete len:179 (-),score=33.25 TRINITY_DN1139_c0_g1_i1:75-611(-)